MDEENKGWKFPLKLMVRKNYDLLVRTYQRHIEELVATVEEYAFQYKRQKEENADLHRRLGAMRCSQNDHQWSGGMVSYPEGALSAPSVAPRKCHWCGKEDEGYRERVLEELSRGGTV